MEYYRPGERREHKIKERDLWILLQAGRALLELDSAHQLLTGPMDHTMRLHLVHSVEKCETMIEWRERYG